MLLLPLTLNAATFPVRGEVNRYTLLRDRTLIERQGVRSYSPVFFSPQITISSGTKSLITELEETSSITNTTTRGTEILGLLNRYINTERYVDANVRAEVPLPYLKVKDFRFIPNFGYQMNMGASLSISNFGDVSNPRAQTYIKKETKMGLFNRVRYKDHQGQINLYKMTRADAASVLTYTNLVSDSKVINFDTLNQESKSTALDIAYEKNIPADSIKLLGQISEIKISQSGADIKYEHAPLLHAQIQKFHKSWIFFGGSHYRKYYGLDDGLYLGADWHYQRLFDFHVQGVLNNESVTLRPSLGYGVFNLSYGMRMQMINPVNNMWVPSSHLIYLQIALRDF